MEDKRSSGSGFFDVETSSSRPPTGRSLSQISLTAGLSVAVLFVGIVWSFTHRTSAAVPGQVSVATVPGNDNAGTTGDSASDAAAVSGAANGSGAASSNNVAQIGPAVIGTLAADYDQLQQEGAYTPQAAAAVATQLAPDVQAPLSYKTFSITDITTTSDLSYQEMLVYQKALQQAMSPLANNIEPEVEILALYEQTKDPKYLAQLDTVAQEYAEAADNASKLTVPADAVVYHVAILNAMEEFSAVLSGLANDVTDPITEIALLNSMTTAQNDMINSFDTMGSYFSEHSKS